jgi:hypothetical protein
MEMKHIYKNNDFRITYKEKIAKQQLNECMSFRTTILSLKRIIDNISHPLWQKRNQIPILPQRFS